MMITTIVYSYLVLNIVSLTFVKTLDEEFQSNVWIVNHGFVIPRILSGVRTKRWVDLKSQVYVSISKWVLKAHPNNKLLVSPKLSLQWVASDNSTNRVPVSGDDCGILHGHVHNKSNSRVIMTICGDNFYVFFRFDNRSFTVNPIANGSHVLEESRLRNFHDEDKYYSRKIRRDLMNANRKSVYNLTGDIFELDDEIKSKNIVVTPNSDKHKSQDYFSDRKWIHKKLSSSSKTEINDMASLRAPMWLELGIAVDYSVIDFHGERVQQYVFALLNIVSAIYRDPTLEANLTLVIVRMIFYIEKKDGMVRSGNARKSLENVNRWNRNFLSSTNETHDVAVWLTRLDIGGPSGYAPVSGVCDPTRSCALNRDEGLTSAFIIAHELAHILGLTHDGDSAAGNSCGHEASMGSIMAPMVAATFHRFHWSSCSKKEYHHQAKQWTCLSNYPNTDNLTYPRDILHETFTMDEQCRMEFGDGYQLCRSFNSPGLCSHLWCSHKRTPKVCKTKKGPPLDGTMCGKNKWCVNGYCEQTSRTIFDVGAVVSSPKGSWSEWGPWSKCSRTCGVGVQIRLRLCNNPLFIDEGKNCEGSSNDVMICEYAKCPLLFDLRKEQCSRFTSINPNKISGKHKTTWLPHLPDDTNDICRLTCRNVVTGHIHMSNNFVIDGTPCSYNSSNICIQGKCHPMGCDNILNSKKRFDDCGICDGDNSTCITINNKFQRNIRKAMTRVATVPAASYNINIEVVMLPISLTNGAAQLIIRDGQNKKYEVKTFCVKDNFSILIIEGTEFKIEMKTNQYRIIGRGPTLNDVVVSLRTINNEKKFSMISVNFHYVTNRTKKFSYSWSLGGWSSCTLTCGGGIKRQTIACKNDQTGKIENRKKCLHVLKPTQGMKFCNTFSCEFKWIAGEWEGCTKTCGSQGVQQRQIYCVHSSFPNSKITRTNINSVYRAMLPPNICQSHHAPETQRECNRFPCPGDWIFTEWSTCSQSCGQGVQSRVARCVSSTGERRFNCDVKSTPDERRPCKGKERKRGSCARICRGDNSHYCMVPYFNHYCQIAEFRKYCCHTCATRGL